MEQFERIRRDHREEGVSIRELARRHNVHRRAVRQALVAAVPPPRAASPRPAPAIGPHAATIRRWLTEDQVVHHKQRHTARRVWERLLDEEGADLAESTVRRFVRETRHGVQLRSGAPGRPDCTAAKRHTRLARLRRGADWRCRQQPVFGCLETGLAVRT